ncbi:MAG: hypothetical protein WCK26_00445 [Candidatus Saccharibacteria bacterium]
MSQIKQNIKKPRNKKWLIIIIILLISCSVFGVYYIYNNFFTQKKSVQTIKEKDKLVDNSNILTVKVEAKISESGYQAGQNLLDEELQKSSDPKDQAQIYSLKSMYTGSYGGGNDKVKALEYAYKAENLYPDKNTALSIATQERYQNNIPNAIKYYKLYLERAKNGPVLIGQEQDDYDFYELELKKLESGVN